MPFRWIGSHRRKGDPPPCAAFARRAWSGFFARVPPGLAVVPCGSTASLTLQAAMWVHCMNGKLQNWSGARASHLVTVVPTQARM